jgi:flagella basal body P-ring formation protein FlgA
VGKLDGTTSNIWLLTILLVTTGLLAPKSSCAWVLELKPEATLEGPAVHIRDICASEIPEDLGAIVLRDGMQPGQIYSISGRNILRRLVSLRKARNISLKGADACEVVISSRSLQGDVLEGALMAELRTCLPTDPPTAPATWLEVVSDLPKVSVGDDWQLYLVNPSMLQPGRNLVQVRVAVGTRSNRFTATVMVHKFGEVGSARTRIKSGDALLIEDFNWEWQDLSKLDSGLLTSRNGINGMIATTDIPIDSYLRQSHVKLTPLVRQGEPVELLLGRGGVEISLRGTARQDGSRGQIVSVRNDLNGKLVTGRVLGPGVVAWRK